MFCVSIILYILLLFTCILFSHSIVHSSERPGPEASAGAFALPRCAPQGGCDEGLDEGLMDGIE